MRCLEVGEMKAVWEALMPAVAARSYALAWTREGTGGDICTNEGCQVYKNSNKGGKWEEAVNATRGWVLMKDGKLLRLGTHQHREVIRVI